LTAPAASAPSSPPQPLPLQPLQQSRPARSRRANRRRLLQQATPRVLQMRRGPTACLRGPRRCWCWHLCGCPTA
jgi:hypothetical protein